MRILTVANECFNALHIMNVFAFNKLKVLTILNQYFLYYFKSEFEKSRIDLVEELQKKLVDEKEK